MRCESCQKITLADLRHGQQVLQQPSVAALKHSAESGCDLCTLSYAALISSYGPNHPDFLQTIRREHLGHDTGVRLCGLIYDMKRWNEYASKMEMIQVIVGEDTEADHLSAHLKIYAGAGQETDSCSKCTAADFTYPMQDLHPQNLLLAESHLKIQVILTVCPGSSDGSNLVIRSMRNALSYRRSVLFQNAFWISRGNPSCVSQMKRMDTMSLSPTAGGGVAKTYF